MVDAFDSAIDNFSEESERRRSYRIKQEFACEAMGEGLIRRLLARLSWRPQSEGRRKYFCFL